MRLTTAAACRLCNLDDHVDAARQRAQPLQEISCFAHGKVQTSWQLHERAVLSRFAVPLRLKATLPRLGEIHIRTLLLVGDADIPDVHAHARAIEAGIPRAGRVVISDVGHLMYLEKPAEFSRMVIEFLENHEDRKAKVQLPRCLFALANGSAL